MEEATILTEITEVVPTDGTTTMTSLETAIDDRSVGLPTGTLLGMDPPAEGHRVGRPMATPTFGDQPLTDAYDCHFSFMENCVEKRSGRRIG